MERPPGNSGSLSGYSFNHGEVLRNRGGKSLLSWQQLQSGSQAKASLCREMDSSSDTPNFCPLPPGAPRKVALHVGVGLSNIHRLQMAFLDDTPAGAVEFLEISGLPACLARNGRARIFFEGSQV